MASSTKVRALVSHVYAGQRYAAGDEYVIRSKDLILMRALGRIQVVVAEPARRRRSRRKQSVDAETFSESAVDASQSEAADSDVDDDLLGDVGESAASQYSTRMLKSQE